MLLLGDRHSLLMASFVGRLLEQALDLVGAVSPDDR